MKNEAKILLIFIIGTIIFVGITLLYLTVFIFGESAEATNFDSKISKKRTIAYYNYSYDGKEYEAVQNYKKYTVVKQGDKINVYFFQSKPDSIYTIYEFKGYLWIDFSIGLPTVLVCIAEIKKSKNEIKYVNPKKKKKGNKNLPKFL